MLNRKLHFEPIPVENVLKIASRPTARPSGGIRRDSYLAMVVGKKSEQKKELWRELCEQAAVQQDPQKLHALAREIIRVLEAKAQPFEQPRSNTNGLRLRLRRGHSA